MHSQSVIWMNWVYKCLEVRRYFHSCRKTTPAIAVGYLRQKMAVETDNGVCVLSTSTSQCPVYTPDTDKTRLSCLLSGMNRIDNKSRLSATENFETVLSSFEMRCEHSFVLSRPSFQWGLLKTVSTCHQFCSHLWQDGVSVLSHRCQWCEQGVMLTVFCRSCAEWRWMAKRHEAGIQWAGPVSSRWTHSVCVRAVY